MSRADEPGPISLASAAPRRVERYGRYEVAFRLEGEWRNPFDPQEVDVQAVFTTPSGQDLRQPAFSDDERGNLWRLRFAPREAGIYLPAIVVTTPGGRSELALPPLHVVESARPGFVRVAEGAPPRLRFDQGGMFLPISITLWGAFFRDRAGELPRLREAGINHFRLLVGEKHAGGAFALEHSGLPAGRYDLDHARNLDRLFTCLEALDMYVSLNLIEHAEFRVNEPYRWFADNAYSTAKGGPCAKPADFFSHPEAKRLFRQRLRYLLARWGYSPGLATIQLWAEVDFSDGYADDPEAVRTWHQEMADYLHATDAHGHLLTTSVTFRGLSTAYERAGLFQLPGLDVAATEMYNERDMAEAVRQDARHVIARYRKPQWLVECGLTHEVYADDRDTEGIHLHAALWAAAVSGSAGTPSFWWWSKVLELGLLPHFRALARYLEGEDFAGLAPIEPDRIEYARPPAEPVCGDLTLPMPVEEVAGRPTAGQVGPMIVVPNDGSLPVTPVPRTLAPGRPLTFDVDYAADGEFVMAGWWLPDTGVAKLRVSLDGEEVLALDLAGVGWQERFTRYREYLGVPWSFPVPGGKHRIVVENVGDAWMTVSVDLANYLRPGRPNLRAWGLGDASRAYLWVQNRDHTWWRNRMGKAPRPVSGAVLVLSGMQPGEYEIEWWDTYAGAIAATDRGAPDGCGRLTVSVPTVARDVACKVRRH